MTIEQQRDQTLDPHMMIAYLQDELAATQHRVETLETALVNARRIGAAVGIVMATLKITQNEAFRVLSRISQRDNRKLRDIADDVVSTGTF